MYRYLPGHSSGKRARKRLVVNAVVGDRLADPRPISVIADRYGAGPLIVGPGAAANLRPDEA